MALIGKPPYIKKVRNVPLPEDYDSPHPRFRINGEAVVPGKVKIKVKTAYRINWPAENWYKLPLELEIIVSNIRGVV